MMTSIIGIGRFGKNGNAKNVILSIGSNERSCQMREPHPRLYRIVYAKPNAARALRRSTGTIRAKSLVRRMDKQDTQRRKGGT